MLFDSASMTLPFICFGLYSSLPLQIVQIVSGMPFLFMIFFSTTFSPGAGVEGVKELRFLFARFYLWCRVPGVKEDMEGCPPDDTLVWYTILTGCLGLILFLSVQVVRTQLVGRWQAKRQDKKMELVRATSKFSRIQAELHKKVAVPVDLTQSSAASSAA